MKSNGVMPVEWTVRIEWHEFYPWVSEHYGRPWRWSTNYDGGQNTYSEYDIHDGPEGPEDWWSDDPYMTPDRFMEEWKALDPAATVDGWGSLRNYEREQWWAEREPTIGMILWDLCRTGYIGEGSAIVTMWW